MATFNDLYSSFDSDPAKRGKQFERFVKWFLKKEPEWSTQIDHVWLWDEFPERWGKDCGIDLVFKHKNGQLWAVQAKCYSPEYNITKQDVDKFLSESNRSIISKRLLIATTDNIGANAKQVCDAQDKTVVRFLLSNFEAAQIDYPARIENLSKAKRKDPPTPRPHQLEAIAAVVENFKAVDRGQLIMACGTGKTFTTLWIKENLKAKTTLVLLPSLSLLSQTLREWTFAAQKPFDVLCVCSDQTVSKRTEDEIIHCVSDLAFPVTSSTDDIKQFLAQKGAKVIFSTYQSSPLIAQAQSDANIPAFDLVVADEAHRCAGKVGGDFSTVLNGKKIRATKRLFATATPRIYATNIKAKAEERDIEIIGMDDEAVFGKVLYALPFAKAIEKKLLTDYQVVIIGVDDPTIAKWIHNREIVKPEKGEETDAEYLAAQIGLLKAIKDYNLKRMISFHSRVKRAEEFAADIQDAHRWLSDEHKPSGKLRADFVSGAMVTSKRKQKIENLKTIGKNERVLLSNARCLAEGVDVPTLDGVAFIDPKSSAQDIIQAVGRAIRKTDNKTVGTIVLPVFIKQGDDAVTSIEASNFKPVWDVLNALKSHDEKLALELNEIRTKMGQRSSSKTVAALPTKIIIDLPISLDGKFSESLRSYLVDQTTASWFFMFGLLVKFVGREGHADVSGLFKTADGYQLGWWVGTQRKNKVQLTVDRKARLDELGFVWAPLDEQWEEGFHYLKEFVDLEEHVRVAATFKTEDGYSLGRWVRNQRKNKDQLIAERKARLDALGFVWDPLYEKWEEGFRFLKEFVEREGHADVSGLFKTADGYKLGQWVGTQRKNIDQLTSDKKARLDALGFIFSSFDEKWEEGFRYLKEFVECEGHAHVIATFKTEDGYSLGGWVRNQRKNKDQLTFDRETRLEALGFVWDQSYDKWEEGFRYLKDFVGREGHTRVVQSFKTVDGYNLGIWIGTQRTNKDQLTVDRKTRLEALGFVWDALYDKWEDGFRYLHEFVKCEGHARVAYSFKTADGYKLGQWISSQRTNKDQLIVDRKTRLEALGFMWDPLDEQWEKGFHYLKEFVEREGHTRVTQSFKTVDGYRLGQWIKNQQRRKDQVTIERKARLEALPQWSWNPAKDK